MKKKDRELMDLSLKLMGFCERNGIDKRKYFIKIDEINGLRFAIAKRQISCTYSVSECGGFYTYSELIAWLDGYTAAKRLNLFL